MLAWPLNNIGPSRSWVPLPGMFSHLNSALFHGICPARFTSSLKLLFSPRPGLRAPLSSYLEVALYKFHRSIDRQCYSLQQKVSSSSNYKNQPQERADELEESRKKP